MNQVIAYGMPNYTIRDKLSCLIGFHRRTRKLVVDAKLRSLTSNNIVPVQRYFCACGMYSWIRYDGSFVDMYIEPVGGHRRWIESYEHFQNQYERLKNEYMDLEKYRLQ